MTIQEILHEACSRYKLAPLDLELLLSYALKKPREYIFAHSDYRPAKNQVARFKSYVSRRLRGEPIAYIIGKKEFYGLEFKVNRSVLIPRPETELLVEATLRGIMNYELGIRNIVDIGTGSGNMIVSIVKNTPANARQKTTFYAVDISEKALRVAKINAKRHKVDRRIKFIKSDLLEFASKKDLKGNILLVANLPYVSPKLYRENQENLRFEPKTALISGKNGLAHYIKLFRQIKVLFNLGFMFHVTCYLEISPEQRNSIKDMAKKYLRETKIMFHKDLAGKNRVLEIVLL